MIISHNQVNIDLVKIQGKLDWPELEMVKQVRGFLRFGNSYQYSINHYFDIARSLIELTKKNSPFIWTSKCKEASQELKHQFTIALVLITSDFDKPVVLECDTLLVATAAIP
jgi:hypothetical protein